MPLAVVLLSMLPSHTLSRTALLGRLGREYYVLVVAATLWFILRAGNERAGGRAGIEGYAEILLGAPRFVIQKMREFSQNNGFTA